jgi:hypothetical protein
VGDAAMECWRYYNSMAGRAAYVASLCETLQDLTLLALEYREYPASTAVDGSQTPADSQTSSKQHVSLTIYFHLFLPFLICLFWFGYYFTPTDTEAY